MNTSCSLFIFLTFLKIVLLSYKGKETCSPKITSNIPLHISIYTNFYKVILILIRINNYMNRKYFLHTHPLCNTTLENICHVTDLQF